MADGSSLAQEGDPANAKAAAAAEFLIKKTTFSSDLLKKIIF
jgi:hypothetical protein